MFRRCQWRTEFSERVVSFLEEQEFFTFQFMVARLRKCGLREPERPEMWVEAFEDMYCSGDISKAVPGPVPIYESFTYKG